MHYAGGLKGATAGGWDKLAGHFQRYRSLKESVYTVAEHAGLTLDFDQVLP